MLEADLDQEMSNSTETHSQCISIRRYRTVRPGQQMHNKYGSSFDKITSKAMQSPTNSFAHLVLVKDRVTVCVKGAAVDAPLQQLGGWLVLGVGQLSPQQRDAAAALHMYDTHMQAYVGYGSVFVCLQGSVDVCGGYMAYIVDSIAPAATAKHSQAQC